MRLTIYDIENNDYYKMPKKIFKYNLTPTERELYTICFNKWLKAKTERVLNDNGEVIFYANQEEVAKLMKITRRTIIKAFKRLIELELIRVKKERGEANQYILTEI